MFPVMERAVRLLAFHLFQHLHLLPFQHHLKRKTGEVTGIIEMATQSFPRIVWSIVFALFPLIGEGICVIGVVAFICGISYALVFAMCLILFIAATRWSLTKTIRPLRKANLSHLKTNSKIVDSLLNFSAIKYFHSYDAEFEKINQALDYRELKINKSLIKNQMVRVYQTLILSLSFLVLIIFSGYSLLSNKLSLGEFIMIQTYMLQFAIPLEGCGEIFKHLNESFAKMEKALKILKSPLETKKATITLAQTEPLHIVFEDVWFGYQKDMPILKGVSFELPPKQTLAIVGETGSGKSSIISLLLGFSKPWAGRVIINGHDLKDIDKESFMNLIGVVPQDVTLFNDTISHNILYAHMVASKKNLKDAVEMASLTKTIEKLPGGLETIVGERGVKLSGGEKQRVGLARAIIRDPKLYVFDEATSSLDAITERKIIKNIEHISQKASTLIIAHRLSTVAFADRIILLENGLIKDKTHDSLIDS